MWRSDVNINVETLEQDVANVLKSDKSKSTKMKLMFDLGLSVKEIAQIMDVRYNFVYNVVSNYVNINQIPVDKDQMESKKGQIIELFLQGKTNREISRELKLNYNYIYKVVREYAEQNMEKLRPVTGAAASVPQAAVQTQVQPIQTLQVDPQEDLQEQVQMVVQEVTQEEEVVEQTEQVSEVLDSAVNAVSAEREKHKVEMPPVESSPWKPTASVLSGLINRRSR